MGAASVHWENHLVVITWVQHQSTSHGNAMIPILQMRKLERFNDLPKNTTSITRKDEWSLNLVLFCYTALPPRLSGKWCNPTQEFISGSSPQSVYLKIKTTTNSVYIFYSLACSSQGWMVPICLWWFLWCGLGSLGTVLKPSNSFQLEV